MSDLGKQPDSVNVVFLFSRPDETMRDELANHLATLRRQGLIRDWDNRKIEAGAEWREAIEHRHEAADIFLLFISADFLASDFCHKATRQAIEQQQSGQALVIPIIIRPCDWANGELARYQSLPSDAKPVTNWFNRDEAWDDVVRGIRVVVERYLSLRTNPGASLSKIPVHPLPHARPTPSYNDEAFRTLSHRLEEAREHRLQLRRSGQDTIHVDREIIDLRRQLREGGRLRAGDSLNDGRYLLLEVIGRGGFAVVWKAFDQNKNTLVAIKVLHSELAGDTTRRERFFRGARVMQQLRGPGVVRVIKRYGEDAGYYYFVMEYLPRGTLRDAVLEKQIPQRSAIRSVLAIGDALVRAHSCGLVHRDIKPTNILIDDSGTPKLTDFDLVGGGNTTGGTRTGAMGTWIYAAPELMHRPQDADARCDVYSLGMTAIFVFSKKELSTTTLFNTRRIIDRLPCNRKVKAVLARAVDPNRQHRFQDAAAFCSALRKATVADPSFVESINASKPLLAPVFLTLFYVYAVETAYVYVNSYIRSKKENATILVEPDLMGSAPANIDLIGTIAPEPIASEPVVTTVPTSTVTPGKKATPKCGERNAKCSGSWQCCKGLSCRSGSCGTAGDDYE